MSSSRKRKERVESRSMQNLGNLPSVEGDLNSDPSLFIQAYEADIIRGAHATLAATSLEISDSNGIFPITSKTSSRRVGDGLIKWGDVHSASQPAFPQDEEDDIGAAVSKTPDDDAIWVDRYDARLLLDTLPPMNVTGTSQAAPDSPRGWSDLPSDSEDTFFLSPEEVEDYRRDKKRRHIDQIQEERLRARRAEDGETADEEGWGGSDEEPDKTQEELMRRTAMHILSSPNPAQLEMRILANHGGDKRFAFLRGRWNQAWQVMKGKARSEKQSQGKKESMVGLGALADYGDSDQENGSESENLKEATVEIQFQVSPEGQVMQAQETDGAAKEARRARAKIWIERRRALKEGGV